MGSHGSKAVTAKLLQQSCYSKAVTAEL